jgi:23S rRNA (uridine2552-2'-O)-methyltransferase
MPRRWVRERRKDPFYRKAKREGYRSRASYKLLQIQERFGVIRADDRVVDLGAAPGGWSQVARDLAGPGGSVVGVDLAPIEPLEGVLFLRGDMTAAETVERVKAAAGGKLDAVISDMSPNISGVYAIDHARSVFLCEQALAFARMTLRRGGNFVCKVFGGDLLGDFVSKVAAEFGDAKIHSPAASRSSSSEVYVVARGFGAARRKRAPARRSKEPGAERATGGPSDEDGEAALPGARTLRRRASKRAPGAPGAAGWKEGTPIGDYD